MVKLPPSSLPVEENIVFKDSSFFKQEKDIPLPPPSDILAAADMKDPRYGTNRAQLTHFPSLRLTVKWGREVTIAEGQCLWAIRRQFSGAIPVPELYGWCREDNTVYIYMEMVSGTTLEERWDNLSPDERSQVCEQLRGIVAALGSLEQDPDDKFIGNIAKQPLLDIIFTSSCSPPAGPFPDITSFLDFFAHLPHTYDRTSGEPPHPMRSQLTDNVPIKFTHGDLCRSNIMLSSEEEGSPVRIVAIIDWHQSGWLPAYWEFCKARWTAHRGEEWEAGYIPRFLESYKQYDYWDYFVLSIGV